MVGNDHYMLHRNVSKIWLWAASILDLDMTSTTVLKKTLGVKPHGFSLRGGYGGAKRLSTGMRHGRLAWRKLQHFTYKYLGT